MTAAAAWVGIIVSDLAASRAWYADHIDVVAVEDGPTWAKLDLPNGTCLELTAGERDRVGHAFPSYGGDHGPPVMPGFAVEDPGALADEAGLEVARSLPGWVVVAGPDRLRVVLTTGDPGSGRGLIGFRFTSPLATEGQRFLGALGVPDGDVAGGDEVEVVPVLRGARDAELVDPDGTRLIVTR